MPAVMVGRTFSLSGSRYHLFVFVYRYRLLPNWEHSCQSHNNLGFLDPFNQRNPFDLCFHICGKTVRTMLGGVWCKENHRVKARRTTVTLPGPTAPEEEGRVARLPPRYPPKCQHVRFPPARHIQSYGRVGYPLYVSVLILHLCCMLVSEVSMDFFYTYWRIAFHIICHAS